MEGRNSARATSLIALSAALVAGLYASVAPAQHDVERSTRIGGLELNWTNRFSAGVAMRTQDRDYRLVDKQNHPDNQAIYMALTDENNILPLVGLRYEGYFGVCEQRLPQWQQFAANGPSPDAVFFNTGDCMSQAGDPQPSQWLLSRPGGYTINNDDGTLNYDKGDVTYANLRLRSELAGAWRNYTFKVGGIAFHDPVNNPGGINHPARRGGFQTHLSRAGDLTYAGRSIPDTAVVNHPPGGLTDLQSFHSFYHNQTRIIERPDARPQHVADMFTDLRVLEAYVSGVFDVADRDLQVTIGNQYLRWGESTFTIFNTLNQVNPLSAILYRQPGSEVRDGFLPVGMITANLPFNDRMGVEVFYQYDWKATEPDICGSFLSTSDVAGCGRGDTPIYLGLGNAPEAPIRRQWRPGGSAGTQTNTGRTIYLEDERFGQPQNGKQFGVRLDYYSDFLGGTEVSLYGMNIHSRLPYYSVLAAQDTCTGRYEDENYPHCVAIEARYRDASDLEITTQGERSAAGAYQADSLRAFFDYPEDIRIFGMSGTTTVGDWSFAGEVSYSPNQPAQVSVVDVTYAGLQPMFGEAPTSQGGSRLPDYIYDWHDVTLSADGGVGVTVPHRRVAVPDFLMSRYRSGCGAGNPVCESEAANAIRGGDYIPGFERLKVGQVALTGIRIFSGSNPLWADQIMFVGELAAIRVFDMPGLDQLQFQGAGAQQTHYSPGHADYDPVRHSFGAGGELASNVRYLGPTDRYNPRRASPDIFADDFAWGYRIRLEATYNDLIWGTGFRPRVQLYHDVQGTSISPGQDFVHGRKEWTLQNEFIFNNSLSAIARYVIFHGAGDRNMRGDRDYAEVSFTYAF